MVEPHFIKPWSLHLQKLGLELKCPSCLKLYNQPMLLPCDHIFCSCCLSKSNDIGSKCSLCKFPYVKKELRQAPYMERVVGIYRCLDISFSKYMFDSDIGTALEQCSFSAKEKFSDQSTNGSFLRSEPCDTTALQNAEKSPQKISVKRDLDIFEAQGINGHCDSALKKQKLLYQSPCEMREGHSPPSMSMNPQNQISITSDMNPVSGIAFDEDDSASLLNFTCAFCQTWKITEASQEMQHFVNRKQVFGSDASCRKAIHVHKRCIDWAPQIFFGSDYLIKNLDKELARAGKLKCTSCGLKGAALGCYEKSCRRSYHVTCAFEIEECRWDPHEYLMFCPSHTSHKFPREEFEKSVMKICTTSAQTSDEQESSPESKFWASSPTGAKNWVLCGSDLSVDEMFMLVNFAKLCGATVTKAWNPNVTHVIAATYENGACSRTLKVLMAILKGSWVLNMDWVSACMQSKCPADEDPYEIRLDSHGCYDGPRSGRLRALNNAPHLFNDLKFLFTGDFVPSYKSDLQNLIITAGGTILEKKKQLQQCCGSQSSPSTALVIYNSDDVIGSTGRSVVLLRRVDAEMVAVESRSQVIPHTWILDSVASCELQPFPQM